MAIKRGIRLKIFLLSATIILIPLTVLSLFVMRRTVTTAEKNHENYQLASMKKVGQAVETILRELERASMFMIGDKDIRTYLSTGDPELLDNVYNTLIYIRNNSDYIKAIQIEGVNGEVLANGSMPLNITRADRERAVSLNGKSFWGQDEDLYGERYVYLCRLLRDTQNPSRHLGTAKLYLDSRELSKYLRSEVETHTNYVILDEEGRVLFNTGVPEEKTDILDYDGLLAWEGRCYRTREPGAGDHYYLSPYGLAAGGWILCGVSGTGDVDSMISASFLLILGLSVSCFLVCAALALLVSRRILKPLSEVIRHMDTFGHQDFSTRIEVRGNDEAALVARHFNQMADQIQDLIHKVYEGTIRKKEAELRALQAQINPHFLYNTLDTIVWLAEGGQNREVVDMVTSLSEFFRTTLSGGKDFITMREEIGHIESYLQIQKIRYQDIMDYEVTLEKSLEECRILKLTLQPLVENALYHGIKNKRGRGRICVRGYAREDMAVFQVEDDGAGMTEEELRAVKRKLKGEGGITSKEGPAPKGGFGLFNVAERLRLNYGPRCSLEFESVRGQGTRAVVSIPLETRPGVGLKEIHP